jgi:predicted nuclease with TOPRIM domain
MDDTEVVTLTKKPRGRPNTKPEVAREKLKEKRERLKKEKEELIIQEAKKRLAEEEANKKIAEEKAKADEEAKKNTDPMFVMMKRMEEMMSMLKPTEPKIQPMEEEVKPKPKRTVKPKEPKEVSPKLVKKEIVAKPKAPRKKKVYYEAEDSPSNVFIGSTRNNIPEPPPPIQMAPQPSNMLLANLMRGRRMNGNL